MNNSINYSDFADMVFDTCEDFEPYGYSDINESMGKIYGSIQTSKAVLDDRDYLNDE